MMNKDKAIEMVSAACFSINGATFGLTNYSGGHISINKNIDLNGIVNNAEHIPNRAYDSVHCYHWPMKPEELLPPENMRNYIIKRKEVFKDSISLGNYIQLFQKLFLL